MPKRVLKQSEFYLEGYTVPYAGDPLGLLKKPLKTVLFDCLLYVVLVPPAYSQPSARFRDVSEYFPKLKGIELPLYDIMFLSHGYSFYC